MREKKVNFMSLFFKFSYKLSFSQKQDECSYVSLRDVVRAMIVFEWFLEKLSELKVLAELLSKKEEKAKALDKSFRVSMLIYVAWLVGVQVVVQAVHTLLAQGKVELH